MPAKDRAVDFVLFADAHLQAGAWANRPIRGDAYDALRQIVDFAIMNNAEAVVSAGDLLDRQTNRSEPISRLDLELARLQTHEIPFYFVQGQHCQADPPWPSSHLGARHLAGDVVRIGDTTVAGLDYLPADALQEALNNLSPSAEMLVCHQTWSEFMGEVGRPQGSLTAIPCVRWVFTGDYHKYELLKLKGANGQAMQVCSPGSTCLQEISEPVDKYFVSFSRATGFTRHELKTRRVVQSSLLASEEDLDLFFASLEASLAEVEAYSQQLPPELQKPLMRIHYAESLRGVVSRVEDRLKDRVHLFWKTYRTETADTPATIEMQDTPPTALALLPTVCDRDSDPDVYDLVEGLLQSDDYRAYCKDWVAARTQAETEG